MAATLSPSRASDFMQCPLLYRFRAIDKLPEPATPAMARGTLVHAVLERLFDRPPVERTRGAAADLLPGEWSRMVQERAELARLVDDTDAGRAQAWFDEALTLIERWFTVEDPTRLEPAEREYYVEADVGGLTLRGYVDRLDVAADGRMRVVDYKTGRAPAPMFEARALFQLKFYGLVLWRFSGRLPARLQLVYLGSGEVITCDPDEGDLIAVERKVRALWEAIERAVRGRDFRPSPSRLCSSCAYRELCPTTGGTPPPLPEDALGLVPADTPGETTVDLGG